jgi:CheY-like chemotaxis protein
VAASFRPTVVLLDIGLPKLSGYEVCRRIRQQAWGKDMVLVALTGWAQEDDRRQSKAAGFDHHMVKPVDFTILMNLLAEVRAAPV